MLNIVSILIGLVALALAIPSTILFLGWCNWFVLPIAVVGIGVGAVSWSHTGRNSCLFVYVIAVFRLMLGGGSLCRPALAPYPWRRAWSVRPPQPHQPATIRRPRRAILSRRQQRSRPT